MPLFTYKKAQGGACRFRISYAPLPYPSSAPFTPPARLFPCLCAACPLTLSYTSLYRRNTPHTAQISAAAKEGKAKEHQSEKKKGKKREEKRRTGVKAAAADNGGRNTESSRRKGAQPGRARQRKRNAAERKEYGGRKKKQQS